MLLKVNPQVPANWEAGRYGISPDRREQLAGLLAPHLATPEGQAFVRSLEHGEASEEEGDRG
jgi:hypothetical protein